MRTQESVFNRHEYFRLEALSADALQQAGATNICMIAELSASKPWVVENGECRREQGNDIDYD
jgi:hypothetical protein